MTKFKQETFVVVQSTTTTVVVFIVRMLTSLQASAFKGLNVFNNNPAERYMNDRGAKIVELNQDSASRFLAQMSKLLERLTLYSTT